MMLRFALFPLLLSTLLVSLACANPIGQFAEVSPEAAADAAPSAEDTIVDTLTATERRKRQLWFATHPYSPYYFLADPYTIQPAPYLGEVSQRRGSDQKLSARMPQPILVDLLLDANDSFQAMKLAVRREYCHPIILKKWNPICFEFTTTTSTTTTTTETPI